MVFNLRESETLEFKKSTSQLKAAIISMAAILNKHKEGEIYFGIMNDGTIVGQQVTEKTIRDISQAVATHIEPRVYPKINKVMIEGKSCIHVAFKGEEIPYYANGRAFIRVGDEDKQLSGKEITNIILRKHKDEFQWDNQVSLLGLETVSEKTVRNFMKKANLAGRIDFDFENNKTTLQKLELIKDGNLLNAAQVLFTDKNPMELQMAIFAGNTNLLRLKI